MISVLLKGLISRVIGGFSSYLTIGGAILVAIAVIFFKGKSAGKKVYREAHERKAVKASKRSAKIIKDIQNSNDKEVQDALQKYYRD